MPRQTCRRHFLVVSCLAFYYPYLLIHVSTSYPPVHTHAFSELHVIFNTTSFVHAVTDLVENVYDKYEDLGEGPFVRRWKKSWHGKNFSRVEVNSHPGQIVRGGIPATQQAIEKRHERLHEMNGGNLLSPGMHLGRLAEHLQAISINDTG